VNWPLVFGIANGAALVAWLVLILAPRRDVVVPALRLVAVGGLCLLYMVLIAIGLTGGFGDAGGDVDFTTIAGVRSIFATDGGVTTGWTHYLAFDLFVGAWIAADADQRRISRLIQAPFLLLTFVAGPVGLLLHLILANTLGRNRADG
jgi:Domain of unknown function (DUF4281)